MTSTVHVHKLQERDLHRIDALTGNEAKKAKVSVHCIHVCIIYMYICMYNMRVLASLQLLNLILH